MGKHLSQLSCFWLNLMALLLSVIYLLVLVPNGSVNALSSSTVCNTPTTQNIHFDSTELVQITKTQEDGIGNFTLVQEMTDTSSADKFENILRIASESNNRIIEDVGPGFLYIYLWGGEINNVTRLSPTEIQFDIVLGSNTVPTLPNPCIDPVNDSDYINSATMLNSIYNSYVIGVPSPNSGTALNFIATTYSITTTYYDQDNDGEKSNIDPNDNDKCVTSQQTACEIITPQVAIQKQQPMLAETGKTGIWVYVASLSIISLLTSHLARRKL